MNYFLIRVVDRFPSIQRSPAPTPPPARGRVRVGGDKLRNLARTFNGEPADRATEEIGSDGPERRRRVVRPGKVSDGGGLVRRSRPVSRAVHQGQARLLGRLSRPRRITPKDWTERAGQAGLPGRPCRLP